MQIISAPANACRYDHSRAPIDTIVFHTMVGSEAAARARFQSPCGNDPQAGSAHYGVCLDGRVVQYVPVPYTAYHCGDYKSNQRSVGIEHEDNGDYNGPRTPELYNASADLVKVLMAMYPGIKYFRRHRDISATACPDSLDVERILRTAFQGVTDMTPEEHNMLVEIRDSLHRGPTPIWDPVAGAYNETIGLKSNLAAIKAAVANGTATLPQDVQDALKVIAAHLK